MGTKGDKTKKNICEEAYILFSKRGYKDVTMKDICDKTGLSRGGLYRHYESTEQIVMLVQDTIRTIYPKYYPKEVVDFFCELHCKENIPKDIKNGYVGVLRSDNMIMGAILCNA